MWIVHAYVATLASSIQTSDLSVTVSSWEVAAGAEVPNTLHLEIYIRRVKTTWPCLDWPCLALDWIVCMNGYSSNTVLWSYSGSSSGTKGYFSVCSGVHWSRAVTVKGVLTL